MIDRLKNIWKMGEYQVEETKEETKLVSDKKLEGKPKGKVKIIETEDALTRILKEND